VLRGLIRKFDDACLSGKIRNSYWRLIAWKVALKLQKSLEYKSSSYYVKNVNDNFAQLCDFYGSDKGQISAEGQPYAWDAHTYSDFYSRLFSHCRQNVTKVFECGIGTTNFSIPANMGDRGKPGASLRVLRDYFFNASVYGADIDKDILFDEERIKSFYIDQIDPEAIRSFWQSVGVSDVDLIIDDGLHTFEAGSTLFLHSIDKLSKTGIYIIEDVAPTDLFRYQVFFENKNYVVEFVLMSRPRIPLANNSLVVVRKRL
jgi:hypothetical protein